MLKQMDLINKVRGLCEADKAVICALMYGSFAKEKGDQYSDIEFAVYFEEESLKALKVDEWLNGIAPVLLCYENEFGVIEVIFNGLVRGEFHFEPISNIGQLSEWKLTDWFPALNLTLIVDKSGELIPLLNQLIGEAPSNEFKKQAQHICDCYIGWIVFGFNVLKRGEFARAHCLLGTIQWKLLSLIRLYEEKFENWCMPSRELEKDICIDLYAEYAFCTCNLNQSNLEQAYNNSWNLGKKLLTSLKGKNNIVVSEQLVKQLNEYTITD